jgi:hypothetical protein
MTEEWVYYKDLDKQYSKGEILDLLRKGLQPYGEKKGDPNFVLQNTTVTFTTINFFGLILDSMETGSLLKRKKWENLYPLKILKG